MDNLTNVIGLTSVNQYACWSATVNQDWTDKNASKSGLYIDLCEYIPNLDKVKTIEGSFTAARQAAIQQFKTELSVVLPKYTQPQVESFEDFIGKPHKATYAVRSISESKIGAVIRPRSNFYKDVELYIKKLSLKVNEAGTYVVKIARIHPVIQDSFVADTTIEVDTGGVVAYSTDLDLQLPFEFEGSEASYFIYWEPTGSQKPYNVLTTCGCDDDPRWFKQNLYGVNGKQGDDLSDIYTEYPSGTRDSYGIGVQLEFTCDPLGFLSGVSDRFFTRNHIGTTIAKYLQLAATRHFVTKLLDANEPNAHNILDREAMKTNRHKIKSLTTGLIEWLAERIANDTALMSRTHCFKCKPVHNMRLTGYGD